MDRARKLWYTVGESEAEGGAGVADVFISYSRGKADNTVRQIADALDRAGISCWYMERDSLYGTFAGTIAQEIFSCHVFLLILDEKSNQSEHVQNEVGLAFRHFTEHQPITILPVRIDDCALSYELLYYLNRFTVTSANPPDERRIEGLVKRIAKALNREAQPIAPAAQPPAKIVKRGECGDKGGNVTFTLDENGVLTISGNGRMRDFNWDGKSNTRDTPWWDEREKISLVKIGNGVTAIGRGAFQGCSKLASVRIPDSVTEIGAFAFTGCTGMTSVVIPCSVTSIGENAFRGCAKLKSVIIPDSVTEIGDSAFFGCKELQSVVIPYSVTHIEQWTFTGCKNLTSVRIPDSVTEIRWLAFNGCKNLKSVSVPAKAKIDDDAFPPWVRVERRA